MTPRSTASTAAGPPRRQQRVSCGACYLRRVKCDLKVKALEVPEGVQPSCTNCTTRGMRCVNEFQVASLQTRTKRSIPSSQPVAHKGVPTASTQLASEPKRSSIVPILRPEFFTCPFYNCLRTTRPIIDYDTLRQKYQAFFEGRSQTLTHEEQLIIKILAVWAVSLGIDEDGRESSELPGDTVDILKERREQCDHMVLEVLKDVDRSILRSTSWDGIRALTLLMPLTQGVTPAMERANTYQVLLNQTHVLVTTGALIAPGYAQSIGILAQTYWYIHTHEGITNGLRGRKLLFEAHDIELMSEPSRYAHGINSYASPSLTHSYAYLLALTPIRISTACRMINAALTGPKAIRAHHLRMETGVGNGIDPQGLMQAWNILAQCWDELEELKNSVHLRQAMGEGQLDAFIAAWQIYLFECHNIILGSLRTRLGDERKAQPRFVDTEEAAYHFSSTSSMETSSAVPRSFPQGTSPIALHPSFQSFVPPANHSSIHPIRHPPTQNTSLRYQSHPLQHLPGNQKSIRTTGPRSVLSTSSSTAELVALAEASVRALYRPVIRTISDGMNLNGFFRYDVNLVKDGVLLAAAWSTGEVERHTCLQALAMMRWAYSYSDTRIQGLFDAWAVKDSCPADNTTYAHQQYTTPSHSGFSHPEPHNFTNGHIPSHIIPEYASQGYPPNPPIYYPMPTSATHDWNSQSSPPFSAHILGNPDHPFIPVPPLPSHITSSPDFSITRMLHDPTPKPLTVAKVMELIIAPSTPALQSVFADSPILDVHV